MASKKNKKAVCFYADERFWKKIEKKRKKFMKEQGLNRLTTRAFTGLLADRGVFGLKKNVKKNKKK